MPGIISTASWLGLGRFSLDVAMALSHTSQVSVSNTMIGHGGGGVAAMISGKCAVKRCE